MSNVVTITKEVNLTSVFSQVGISVTSEMSFQLTIQAIVSELEDDGYVIDWSNLSIITELDEDGCTILEFQVTALDTIEGRNYDDDSSEPQEEG